MNNSIDEVTVAQNGQAVTALLTGLDTDQRRNVVVIRNVGTWSWKPGSSDALTTVKFAIHAISGESFTAGALPELETNEGDILYTAQAWNQVGNLGENPNQMLNTEFDIKSRRKLRSQDSELVAQIENVSVTAVTAIVAWVIRTLLWEP